MDGGLLFNSLRPYLIDQPLFHHGHTGSPDENKFEMLFVADGALVKHAVPPRCRIMAALVTYKSERKRLVTAGVWRKRERKLKFKRKRRKEKEKTSTRPAVVWEHCGDSPS